MVETQSVNLFFYIRKSISLSNTLRLPFGSRNSSGFGHLLRMYV